MSLQLRHLAARSARVRRLDAENGDVSGAYRRMGSPTYPTRAQLEQLSKAATLPAPQEVPIVDERLSITLPPYGLATVEVAARPGLASARPDSAAPIASDKKVLA